MVKEGYKQTEIGVIPKDWDYLELPQITQNSSNSIKIGPFGSALKKELLTKSGFKVYGQENIFEKNMQIGDRYVNQEHFNKLKSCEIKTNDFLISMMGTIGKCFIVPEKFEEGIIDSHLIRIRINEAKYNLQLLTHIFGSEFILRQINQLTVGGIMDGLSSKIIKKLYLPIPPKEEQKAIASALSDADELITSLEKLIAKKESIKTATMQQLLTGKKRLNGFSGKWEEKKLGEFLDYLQPTEYLVSSTKYTENGNIPVLTAGKTFILGYTTEENGVFTNLPTIIFDDFTTASKYVTFPFKAKSSAMKMLIPKNNRVNMRFIYEKMSQIQYQVGDHKRHWIGEFSNLNILVSPTAEEQQAITQILSDMDNEIEALKTKLSKTKAIKDGMMSELLSGKTRLKV